MSISARGSAPWIITGLAAACAGLDAAHGQLQAGLPLDMIPEDARRIAQQAAPDAEFYEADMELGERIGYTVEIAGRDARGRHVEVDLYQDGDTWAVEEIERALPWNETPAVIKDALASFYSREWRPTLVERSERAGGEVVYEIEGYDRSNELVELELTDTGDFLSLSKYNAT